MPEDDSKVFDVSKPNKVGPDSTSRPVIVGHKPTTTDPMVKEKEDFSDEDSKSGHTPIHVSIGDDDSKEALAHPSEPEIPSIAKEDIEKALASIEPKETDGHDEHKEHEHASLFGGHKRMEENVISPSSSDSEGEHHEEEHKDESSDEHGEHSDTDHEEHQDKDHGEHGEHQEHDKHDEHKDDSSSALGFTSIHSLIPGGEDDEEKPKHGDSSSYDNGDWQDVAPLHVPQGAGPKRRFPKVLGWILGLALLVVVLGYLAIDLGLVKSDANLPFHIFNKQKKKTVVLVTPPPQAPPVAPAAPEVPDGFTAYKVEGTGTSFDYPTAWGKPTATADPGFSKRGGTNKTDGTYAYLVNFATNKDVQLAVTSSKYLPAARGAQYYDYLQWCTGTNDGKIYKQTLHFTTASGVDTPGTVVCDQGPLADATKLDDLTIVQLKTKSADGKTVLGDLYTQNLSKGDYAVLRVKDTKMANAEDIKKLLGTVSIDSSSSPTSANPQ